ncbi:AMP-binding protein [Hyphococcus sp.]|jgi:fatty-acyl-CoA synthase|uniref:AMP-binding protein n=1 Tax=Hyphococcus sp. TaxID=2038636 RepID=UPI003D0F41A7
MHDLVHFHAQATPEKKAIVDLQTSESYDYRHADQRISQIASFLLKATNGKRGERVAMISRNSAFMLLVHYACARAGLIFVPLNWRLAPPEIGALIEDAQPSVLIWQTEFEALAEPGFGMVDPSRQFRLAETGESFAKDESEQFVANTQAADDDPITLLYTSGTSGKSKGVILTHKTVLYSALNFAQSSAVDRNTVFLCDMPLFHVAGLLAVSRTPLFFGGTVLVSQKFDPVNTFKNLTDPALGVTHYFCVTQMAALMREKNPPGAMKKLAHLTAIQTGGAPNPPAAVRAWAEDGVSQVDGFGMTEIGSAFSMPPYDVRIIREKAGSVGMPSPFTEGKIMTPEGIEAEPNEIGELWVRGPNVTPGYWNKPVETAASFEGEWLKTGDSARKDEDGFYYIVDRTKDMFISGGENVYPVEIEAVLAEMPEILDCAVIGVPDQKWGEVGAAIILLKDGGASMTPEGVIAFVKSRLASYKAPKHVRFVDDLPRTPSGKVQKHKLRDAWTG